MPGAYPLLVDQTDWGMGAHSGAEANASALLLRRLGAELTRPNPFGGHSASAASTTLRDVEIVLAEPPLPPTAIFAHEYPQPLRQVVADGHIPHATLNSVKRKPRPTLLNHHPASPFVNRVGLNRSTQRLDINFHRDFGEIEIPATFHFPQANVNRCSSINNSPRNNSPRNSSSRNSPLKTNHRTAVKNSHLRKEYENPLREASLRKEDTEEDSQNSLNWNKRSNAPQRNMEENGTHTSYALTSNRRPNQFVLCCSPPDYYYSTERLRQEPEPGLCECCEKKVSCCCPCCHTWFPTGNVNSVCTSLVCIGIIMFIVLSPLLHYLVPT